MIEVCAQSHQWKSINSERRGWVLEQWQYYPQMVTWYVQLWHVVL